MNKTMAVKEEVRDDINRLKYQLKLKSASETIEYLIRLFQERGVK